MDALFLVFLALAGIGLVQTGTMLLHAWEHRRFHARRWRSKPKFHAGLRVAIVAPCKGIDPDLQLNLSALFRQRYPEYELYFVVESESDPAVPVINELRRTNPLVPCHLVSAGKSQDCGQKVHNLMCAARAVLNGAESSARPPDVLAFVDSDARPHADWLSRLVERISGEKYAVATGYRWYVPASAGLASRLASAINNVIIGMTGLHRFSLVWGGAWAIRTRVFCDLGLPDAWQGSLSDDLVVSRLVRQAGLRVGYEPHCLVQSPADFTWGGLCEFLRRQFLVVRVYAPGWWQLAFWGGLTTNACFWGTLGLACRETFVHGSLFAAAVMLTYYLAGAARAQFAARAVRPFIAVTDDAYMRVTRLNVWGWPLVALAGFLGVLASAVGRTIVWRGIEYRLDSPRHTTISGITPGPRDEGDSHARSTARAA